MRFEHHTQPMISRCAFARRMGTFALYAFLVMTFSLLMGVLGYHFFGGLHWIDSLLNASMILGGMGPVDTMTSNASKIFSSIYALYSGVAFLSISAVLIAPVLHRFLHRIHLEMGRES
jgi:hypothetical protein